MTNSSPAMRERYVADSISTASPARLLIMLYDRLVIDLTRGEQALLAGNRPEANTQLLHAQDIITELQLSLNMQQWSGAPGLAQLYAYLVTELVNANIMGDADKVATCRKLVEPLCDTWRDAALAVTAG